MSFEKNLLIKDGRIPGFTDGLILIIFSAVLSLAIGLLMALAVELFPMLQPWNIFITYSFTFGIVFIVAKYYWQINQLSFERIPFWIYLLLLPLTISLSILIEGMVGLIPMPEKVQEFFAQMVQLDFYGFLTIGIAAPILEELIFRGVILKSFLKKYDPRKAIMWSAIIFGIAHMNPWQFVPAWLVGILIGWIYWKTQTVWPGIFIHFINNTFSFLVAYKAKDINTSFYEISGGLLNYLILLFICLTISTVLLIVLVKYFEKSRITTLTEL